MLATGRQEGAVRVGLTTTGSELGSSELLAGARLAAAAGVRVQLIGPAPAAGDLPVHPAGTEDEAQAELERLLDAGELEAGVTQHYQFPLGVATVGRAVTPARGRELLVATTTGASATDRVAALVQNAVYGLAVARTCGVAEPKLGILNLDGARPARRALDALRAGGYRIHWAVSVRGGDGLLRGNDVLAGSADVVVTDSLTGNLLMKLLSAFTTGGTYESTGWGYGPGVGPGYDRIICIVSRASGAPVIARALRFAAELARGRLPAVVAAELDAARAAGLDRLLQTTCPPPAPARPEATALTAELGGVDVLELDAAVALLRERGIAAAPAMGCTGPVLMVAPGHREQAEELLKQRSLL